MGWARSTARAIRRSSATSPSRCWPRLFAGAYSGAAQDSSFDVAPDGKRFVTVKSDEASTLTQVTLVQNWMEQVRQVR
jgi:hypothetical protein